MLKAPLAAATLLAATPAAAQQWVQYPGYAAPAELELTQFFLRADKVVLGAGVATVPSLRVDGTSYTEGDIRVTCRKELVFQPATTRARRGGGKMFDMPIGTHKLVQMGSLGGGIMTGGSARAQTPDRRLVKIAEWLCDPERTAAGAGFVAVAADPKPAAWKRIDTVWKALPRVLNAALAREAPALTIAATSGRGQVRSAQVRGCTLHVVMTSGHNATLELAALPSYAPAGGGLTFRDGQQTVSILGFSPEGWKLVTGGLSALRGACKPSR